MKRWKLKINWTNLLWTLKSVKKKKTKLGRPLHPKDNHHNEGTCAIIFILKTCIKYRKRVDVDVSKFEKR